LKILHTADLHIGKRYGALSFIGDMRHILNEIIDIIDNEKIDVILICGDVYDKMIPPEDAINLFEEFLISVTKLNCKALIIAGNHDSVTRLSFGSKFLKSNGIYISNKFDGGIERITLNDEYGNINFYLFPFVKPVHVRAFYPDENISTYDDAVKFLIDKADINYNERNIILSHQFVTGAKITSDVEDPFSVGSLNEVSYESYTGFDYTAFGHIHRPQIIGGNEYMRYSGSPIMYSFSEIGTKKSVPVIEIKNKGDIDITLFDLKPLHEFIEIRGSFDELLNGEKNNNYIKIILTDDNEIPDAMHRLRESVFENALMLEYETRQVISDNNADTIRNAADIKSPIKIINEFYNLRTGRDMNENESNYVNELFDEITDTNL